MRKVKSILIFLILSAIIPSYLKAQWVPIDSAFAKYIKTKVGPAAINGNLLDTTNTSIITKTDFSVTYSNGYYLDISAIKYFKALQNLTLYSFSIASFPQLPSTLVYLNLDHMTINAFSASLPSTLINFLIFGGTYAPLPALPASLNQLRVESVSNITSLPALPASLKRLGLSKCTGLSTLPSLPVALENLDISSCSGLTSFPAWPAGLSTLNIAATSISHLSSLPAGLTSLGCSGCIHITALPVLPKNLSTLYASHCNITTIDTVPRHMSYFYIGNNPLTVLHSYSLPDVVDIFLNMDSLLYLTHIDKDSLEVGIDVALSYCPNANIYEFLGNLWGVFGGTSIGLTYNNLHSIPQLRFPVTDLNLSGNPIDSFPAQIPLYCCAGTNLRLRDCNFSALNFNTLPLPELDGLDMSNNHLTNIDWLPVIGKDGFGRLTLSNNQIPCLPYLTNGISDLSVDGNPINCLPNIPNNQFFSCYPNLPVCAPGNSNNCTVLSQITGTVYNDINSDGIRDTNEVGVPSIYTLMEPAQNIMVTDTGGHFIFECLLDTLYTVSGVPLLPYRYFTTAPFSHSFPVTAGFNQDIGYAALPGVNDMVVYMDAVDKARPGFDHWYHIHSENPGTTVQNGTLSVNLDPALLFLSATGGGTAIGNMVSWDISNLAPLAFFDADIFVSIPPSVTLGTILSNNLQANCNLPDSTPENNIDTLREVVVSAYDPNVKEVIPAGALTPAKVQAGSSLNYTVRFQNTGNYWAQNVEVIDTLSTNLDLTTFKFITASHVAKWSIANRVLTVYFNDIYLPDSLTDQNASHGFFSYKIQPLKSLSPGDDIPNTAYIYFDYNQPVVTNTVSNAVEYPEGINDISKGTEKVTLYPNPANDKVFISATGFQPSSIIFYSVDGRKIAEQKFEREINIASLPSGIYFLNFTSAAGTVVRKLVKM